MADYKLYYFNARGRAEPLRLAFAAADIKYEDVRLTGEQFAAQKAKTPYGQVPYLEYKCKGYGESKAIASFVAKECGMAGKNNVEAMRVDEVYCLVASLLENMAKTFFEKDPATKETMGKTLAEETIPKYLGFFEKLLSESGTGYFVGSALTLADLAVYDICEGMLKMNPKVLDTFPKVQAVRKNVEANDKIKAYLASRPQTEM